MAKSNEPLLSKKSQVICFVLSVCFFLFMWSVLPGFVPTQDPTWATWIAALTASLFGMLFWLASVCFTVVLVDMQRKRSEMPGLNR